MSRWKISGSVYYLSEKDYRVITKHVKKPYRILGTRIDDDVVWEWFGADTYSNYIHGSSEMLYAATFATANSQKVLIIISKNIRIIRD